MAVRQVCPRLQVSLSAAPAVFCFRSRSSEPGAFRAQEPEEESAVRGWPQPPRPREPVRGVQSARVRRQAAGFAPAWRRVQRPSHGRRGCQHIRRVQAQDAELGQAAPHDTQLRAFWAVRFLLLSLQSTGALQLSHARTAGARSARRITNTRHGHRAPRTLTCSRSNIAGAFSQESRGVVIRLGMCLSPDAVCAVPLLSSASTGSSTAGRAGAAATTFGRRAAATPALDTAACDRGH